MKTSDIEIRDLLSVLSVVGVEHRIGEVPGVESVTVNYAAGLATVRYDETRLNVTEIKSAVRQGEYEHAGSAASSHGGGHEDHGPAAEAPETPPPAAPKPPPAAGGAAPAAATATKPADSNAANGKLPDKMAMDKPKGDTGTA